MRPRRREREKEQIDAGQVSQETRHITGWIFDASASAASIHVLPLGSIVGRRLMRSAARSRFKAPPSHPCRLPEQSV
ncbi:MAG: hypothetical protein IMZ50_09495 [Candidatus Atribacteria bacterium]|nr:hypothetical protein [Candidatus Atribacteria bacterium]